MPSETAKMPWQEHVSDPYYVRNHGVYRHISDQLDDAVDRALAAGAVPPLEFVGAGMTGIVFCDANSTGYKVARHRSALFLEDEAEWLDIANQIPGVREHVARFIQYNPMNYVLVRECVRMKRTDWWKRPTKLLELHNRIGNIMEQYGWSAPEFKEDSYVSTVRGPVLVDASMPHRLGRNAARFALDVLEGRRHLANPHDRLRDLAFYVRREVTAGALPRDIANRIIRRIAEQDPSALEWLVAP